MNEKQAKRKANALKKRLGDKWQICVWENLGWHYCVESPCGLITVWEDAWKINGSRKFDCMITDEYKHTGSPGWYSSYHFIDPRKAVEASIGVAKRRLNKWANMIKVAEDLMK